MDIDMSKNYPTPKKEPRRTSERRSRPPRTRGKKERNISREDNNQKTYERSNDR
jgi:hypothetical protein